MSQPVSKSSKREQKCFEFDDNVSSCIEDTLDQNSSQFNKTDNRLCQSENNPESGQVVGEVRKIYEQEFKCYVKQLILKTSCIGFLVGFLIIAVFYDKLFFDQHYYQRSKQYQAGIFGYDMKTMEKLPNYNFDQIPLFEISTSQSVSQYFPPFQSQSSNGNSYHEINENNKKNKYNLQGYLMKDVILKPIEDERLESQYQLAVRLLEVNHNVNFKGEINIQATQFQKTQQDIKAKRERIQKLLKAQKERYQKKYHISKYIDNQLPFCVVVPSYNNYHSKLYLRNLDSIFMQNYQNYHVVYIDDASPDKTGEYVKKYIEERGIPQEKIEVIINENNTLALANIYNAITNKCKSGEIVMLLDGDDSFLGRQVMSLFNAVYQKNQAGLVYSRYLVITGNDHAGIGGSSREIPTAFLQEKIFRQVKGFFTSHLLTFYADLFWKVKKEDLTYQNGTFFKFAYDVALVTPIIEMLGKKLSFIQETTYEYRYDTGINDPGWGQMQVDNIVFSKKPYARLKEFPFIDKFYDEIKQKKQAQK